MRYMAKVLKAALEKKFPEAAEKDVLKVSDKNISLDINSCLQLNYMQALRSYEVVISIEILN